MKLKNVHSAINQLVQAFPDIEITKGYLKNPDATKNAIKSGWLYSGDLGRFDEEGLLYIVDRK